MPSRNLTPAAGFRTSSSSQSRAKPALDDIFFPKLYEDAWGGVDSSSGRTDAERARIFLVRMANMNQPDPVSAAELRVIASDTDTYRTIPLMAAAVQTRVLAGRHASFAATPLLQMMRFLLLKGGVILATDPASNSGRPILTTAQTRALADFYFDPTLARNLDPLPAGELVLYSYPAAPLKVCIVGGGPTALASAISLAEKGRGKVEVHLWERRWAETRRPDGSAYVDYPATAKRRDQVVTLQDSVTALMTDASREALFAGRPERVWPGSANIQIRKVEDRFLKRVQSDEFRGLIHLHPEGLTQEDLSSSSSSSSSKAGDFHVLLGADGAASWVRRSYFHGYENERGRSYALGLAFKRSKGLPWSQPLNMFLTLGQTRYLLNASDHDGCGYLNMQLTDEEWDQMVDRDGRPVTFGNPGCLRLPDGSVPEGFEERQVFAPSENRDSPLWHSIEDGLKLFGFKESEVINVVRIPIVVQAVAEGVQILPPTDSLSLQRPHGLVAVAGDAAMTVHFWPGRGLNSGIKAGMALGDELVHALDSGKFVGMPLDAMGEYNSFLLKLQGREHDKRSIPILNQSGSPEMLGWLLARADSVPDEVAVEWLVGAMAQLGDRLERRADWAFAPLGTGPGNIEAQLRIVLRQVRSRTLKEMAVSFPWPTREMAGAEVLPVRSMRPEEKQRWLQSLWGLFVGDDKNGGGGGERTGRSLQQPQAQNGETSLSNSRFEAPRTKKGTSPMQRRRSPSPAAPSTGLMVPNTTPARTESTLRRSNAKKGTIKGDHNLSVPGMREDGRPTRTRSPSPGPAGDSISLGRMMTVRKKPNASALTDALSLALFRVDMNG